MCTLRHSNLTERERVEKIVCSERLSSISQLSVSVTRIIKNRNNGRLSSVSTLGSASKTEILLEVSCAKGASYCLWVVVIQQCAQYCEVFLHITFECPTLKLQNDTSGYSEISV